MNSITGNLDLDVRTGLPEEWRFMLAEYPRKTWLSHTRLGEHAKFWLSIHRHFRIMGAHLTSLTTDFREGNMTLEKFRMTLAPGLQEFLGTLDHHHRIEDHHFFPLFIAAEKRLEKSIELLEKDHHLIDAEIQNLVESANALLQADANKPDLLKYAGNRFADSSEHIVKLLARHLDDEEEIVVPIMLDRGEVELMGG